MKSALEAYTRRCAIQIKTFTFYFLPVYELGLPIRHRATTLIGIKVLTTTILPCHCNDDDDDDDDKETVCIVLCISHRQVTANLVRLRLKVSPQLICPLPLEVTQLIDDIEVTLLSANQ